MTTQCSWCLKDLDTGVQLPSRLNDASGGICDPCYTLVMGQPGKTPNMEESTMNTPRKTVTFAFVLMIVGMLYGIAWARHLDPMPGPIIPQPIICTPVGRIVVCR